MMIWICPECKYKNEIEEDEFVFKCENCGRTADDVTKAYWEVKPNNFLEADRKYTC